MNKLKIWWLILTSKECREAIKALWRIEYNQRKQSEDREKLRKRTGKCIELMADETRWVKKESQTTPDEQL